MGGTILQSHPPGARDLCAPILTETLCHLLSDGLTGGQVHVRWRHLCHREHLPVHRHSASHCLHLLNSIFFTVGHLSASCWFVDALWLCWIQLPPGLACLFTFAYSAQPCAVKKFYIRVWYILCTLSDVCFSDCPFSVVRRPYPVFSSNNFNILFFISFLFF